jgi:membrane protease YdiL (CAAX protease family)
VEAHTQFEDPPAVQAVPDHPALPDNPPWNSFIAIVVWLSSVFAIILFPLLFLVPYVISTHGGVPQGDDFAEALQKDPTAIMLQVLAVFPAHALTLVIAWFAVTRARKYSFTKTLGWTMGGVVWWHYVLFMLCFFALAGAVNYFVPEQENELIRVLRSSRTAVVLVAIMATFTAPLVEEVIYRGVLYSAFQRTFGPALAVVAVTVLFALVHVPQYYPSVSTMLLLTVLSLTLTLIRARSGNLLPCIVLHTVFNAAQSALLLIEPSLQQAPPEVGVVLNLFK